MDSHISIMDQRRFIYQRNSGAFIQSQTVQHDAQLWQTSSQAGYEDSEQDAESQLGFGKRLLRCLGCLRRRRNRERHQRDSRRRRRSNRSFSGSTAGKPRKLSAKDKVLEYRRRQSTFVPSTLAKPQEDFASHGIIFPHRSAASGGRRTRNDLDCASDYSSCSSSSCSSQQQAACQDQLQAKIEHQAQDYDYTLKCQDDGYQQQQQQQHQQHSNRRSTSQSESNYRSSINYGDYSFGDNYDSNKKNTSSSHDSALADLAYHSSDGFKTDSSCDTLKHLVDQSINDMVPQPAEMQHYENQDPLISPISTTTCNCCEHTSEPVQVSSPTASIVSALDGPCGYDDSQQLCQAAEGLNLSDQSEDHQE